MKKFIIVTTGDGPTDAGVIFIDAETPDDAINIFLFEYQGLDPEETHLIDSKLEDNPIGVGEIIKGEDNPELNWYMELP